MLARQEAWVRLAKDSQSAHSFLSGDRPIDRPPTRLPFAPKARWIDCFLVAGVEPHRKAEMTHLLANSYVGQLRRRGFNVPDNEVGLYFDTLSGFPAQWVLNTFDSSVIARAFYYLLHDKQMPYSNGIYSSVRMSNTPFAEELRDRNRARMLAPASIAIITPGALADVTLALIDESTARGSHES